MPEGNDRPTGRQVPLLEEAQLPGGQMAPRAALSASPPLVCERESRREQGGEPVRERCGMESAVPGHVQAQLAVFSRTF